MIPSSKYANCALVFIGLLTYALSPQIVYAADSKTLKFESAQELSAVLNATSNLLERPYGLSPAEKQILQAFVSDLFLGRSALIAREEQGIRTFLESQNIHMPEGKSKPPILVVDPGGGTPYFLAGQLHIPLQTLSDIAIGSLRDYCAYTLSNEADIPILAYNFNPSTKCSAFLMAGSADTRAQAASIFREAGQRLETPDVMDMINSTVGASSEWSSVRALITYLRQSQLFFISHEIGHAYLNESFKYSANECALNQQKEIAADRFAVALEVYDNDSALNIAIASIPELAGQVDLFSLKGIFDYIPQAWSSGQKGDCSHPPSAVRQTKAREAYQEGMRLRWDAISALREYYSRTPAYVTYVRNVKGMAPRREPRVDENTKATCLGARRNERHEYADEMRLYVYYICGNSLQERDVTRSMMSIGTEMSGQFKSLYTNPDPKRSKCPEFLTRNFRHEVGTIMLRYGIADPIWRPVPDIHHFNSCM